MNIHSKSCIVTMMFLLFGWTVTIQAQRITVKDTTLGINGNPIFINGANMPWIDWNDFGGSYKHNEWDAGFAKFKAAKGNALRIWITCSPEGAVQADETGAIIPPAQNFWDDLDDMFALAESHQIYIMATLISFDHTKNTYNGYDNFRKVYGNEANVSSFVDNYVIPFVNRYKSNPYLFSIEPCNEIEWVNQDANNAEAPWADLRYFTARVVAAVHENSEILTTVGCSMKWQTDKWPGNELNQFSDARLQAAYDDPDAYLDFYSPHFYDWVITWYGNPFLTATVADYGLEDKPVIIGEVPAVGVSDVNIFDVFLNAFSNGFQGVMPWTANLGGGTGNLDTGLGAALTSFANSYPDLVFPDTTAVGIALEEVSGYIQRLYNYPNPFNLNTSIKLDITENAAIELMVYDIYGRRVEDLFSGKLSAGSHDILWDASSLPSGNYFIQCKSVAYTRVIKCDLVRQAVMF